MSGHQFFRLRSPHPSRRLGWARCAAFGLTASSLLCGCANMLYSSAYWVGMPFVYERADLPDDRIVRDIPYWLSGDADPDKNRLDLFLPDTGRDAVPWPALVFVHGGGWVEGDRGFRAGGRDVYANIGRFFASQGVGTAVISYRLQPQVSWHEQVDDVAHAVAWVHDNIASYGGNPERIFVSGHSAGAQLATWVALDRKPLERLGAANPELCGLIPVSGAALDLTDQETYRLGASPAYFERRFRDGEEDRDWKREASPVFAARADAPETLILYATGEPEDLKRQSVVLDVWMRAAGANSRIVEVPGEDHYRIIITLSRPDKTSAPAMLEFIESADCPAN